MNRLALRAARRGLALLLASSLIPALPGFAAVPERTDIVPGPVLDPGFPVLTLGLGFSLPPQFVDLDLDGRQEILAVDDRGVVYAVGANGVPAGGWPRDIHTPLNAAPAVGDIDLDGTPDVVVVTRGGLVRALSGNGTNKFPQKQLPGTPLGGPVLVELDTSGKRAIVVATTDGKLYAIDSNGQFVPGWPVTGPGPAVGGAFTFIAGDNFPRVGYLASPGGAVVYRQSGALDNPYSYDPGVLLGAASPVSGARIVSALSDIDHLYLAAHDGQLYRFDPDVIDRGGDPTPLASAAGDSVVDTPSLVDLTGDLIPELVYRSLNADVLSVRAVDGGAGAVVTGFPRTYPGSSPGGTVLAADLGDGATPELIFNHGGDKVSCIRSNGLPVWTLTGLPAKCGPAIGDLDGDGGVDLAVVTTDGRLVAYDLGSAGVGPKSIEWPNTDGLPDHHRRHQRRDRAAVRAQWPPSFALPGVFVTRPLIADVDGDGLPEVLWSDYATTKTFAWNQATGIAPGFPQTYAGAEVTDAPAVGDVTGDGVYETVQATRNGFLAWGNGSGVTDSLLLDDTFVLTPPSLADLDNDGTLDVVVGSSSGRLYAVNLVTKTVIPGFPVTTSGAISLPPALGDVDGNGQTDIVVVANTRYIYAYPRTGILPLAGWPRVFPVGSSLQQPILVPASGNPGLAVAFAQQRADSVVAHLVGANSASRPGWPHVLVGTTIYGPVAGDFDNDGQPDFVFSTNTDSVYAFTADGGRAFGQRFVSPGDVEVAGVVDLDLDQRPEIVAMSDRSKLLGIRFDGQLTRSFDRLVFFKEVGEPPSFGDLGNDGVMEMALSDLGDPILYAFGYGSWNRAFAPWPMKGHDARRTNAFSGLTVVAVGDPAPRAPGAPGWARALPNPARGQVALIHSRPLAGHFAAAIFDLRGRLVRHIAEGDARAGAPAPTWTWDGADASGRPAPAGVYFYRVVDARGSLATRVVRLR